MFQKLFLLTASSTELNKKPLKPQSPPLLVSALLEWQRQDAAKSVAKVASSKWTRQMLMSQEEGDDRDTHPNKKSKSVRKLPTRLQHAKENGVQKREQVGSPVRKDVVKAVTGKDPSNSKSSSRKAMHGAKWNARFEELVEFHRRYGQCRVPTTGDARLYNWVKKQRAKYRDKDDYPLERKGKLDRLGFC